MPDVLKVQSTTSIFMIEDSRNKLIPQFFHIDSISKFQKRSHEQWATTTIVACIIGIKGTYGCFHQFIIADEGFNSGQCVMVLFKNIGISQTRYQYLCTDASIIISTNVDNFVQIQLRSIHNKLCSQSQTSSREVTTLYYMFTTSSNQVVVFIASFYCVLFLLHPLTKLQFLWSPLTKLHYLVQVYGTLSIASLAVAPYKHVCKKCNLSNLIVVEEGFYYNVCHNPQPVIKQAYVCVKITSTFQVVTMYLEGQWLQTLVRMSKEQFLNLSRKQ